MNGIEKITERITAEANAACQEIAAAAAERSDAIRREYEEKARAAYDQALAQGKEEIEQRSQRQDRTVRLDVKKDMLSLKQELMDDAFLLARDRLLHMPQDKYVDFLARLAAQAAEKGTEEVIFSEKDAAGVGAAVLAAANAALGERGKLTLSAETRPMDGGLVLRSGDIEINCTIKALLEQSRSELAAQVAGTLFD